MARPVRILLTSGPFFSHIRALITAGLALVAAGFEVRIAAPKTMHKAIKDHGLTPVTAGEDWTQDPQVEQRASAALLTTKNEGFCRLIFGELMPAAAGKMGYDVERIVMQWRADFMVCDPSDFGSILIAHRLNIPYIVLDNGLVNLIREYWAGLILPGLAPARSALGVRSEPGTPFRRVLSPAPVPWLRDDWPTEWGELVPYRHEDPTTPADALPAPVARAAKEGRQIIFVSFGTVLTCMPGLEATLVGIYGRIIKALGTLDCLGVISAGKLVGQLRRAGLPPNVHVYGRVAQSAVLAKAVSYANHAPMGGLREGVLTRGLPVAMYPVCTDGPDNAQRSAAWGMGIVRDPFSASVDDFAESMTEVTASPRARHYRARSSLMATLARRLPEMSAALLLGS